MSHPVQDLNQRSSPNNETEYLKFLVAVGPLTRYRFCTDRAKQEMNARNRRLVEYYRSYWEPTFGKHSWPSFYSGFIIWCKKNRSGG